MTEIVPHIIMVAVSGVQMAEWSKVQRIEFLVCGRIRFEPRYEGLIFFLKAIENCILQILVYDEFYCNKKDLKVQFLIV